MNDKMTNKPWFKKPPAINKESRIAIIGAGIAGICSYIHLTKAGFKVALIDRNDFPLSQASGNPAAILDPFLSASKSIQGSYYLEAYQYALRFYASLGEDVFKPSILIKTARNNAELDRFSKISRYYHEKLLSFRDDQLIFPSGGYVVPSALRKYVDSNFIGGQSITKIIQNADKSWMLLDHAGNKFLEADIVIFTNAADITNFSQTQNLALKQLEGQITYVAPEFAENHILVSDGYVSPVVDTEFGRAHICGATFERRINPTITAKAHAENINNSPHDFITPKIIGGRKAVRAMSPDHLPLCGPAPDYDRYICEYEGLHHGPRHKKYNAAPYHNNLFVNVGYGSRGFIHGPILGKYLTNMLNGDAPLFSPRISNALHPARFIIRRLSKK